MVGAREPDGPGLQGLRRAWHGPRPARRSHVPWPSARHGPLRRRPRDPASPATCASPAWSCPARSPTGRAEGVDVTDLGLASTDFLYFASGHLDAPGAMFTASHNPARYNGIKLCLSGARADRRGTPAWPRSRPRPRSCSASRSRR